MRPIFVVLFALVGLLGCSNRYCCPQQTLDNFAAIGNHIARTANEFSENTQPVYYHFTNPHADIPRTLHTIYHKNIDFAHTGKRLQPLWGNVKKQWHEGVRDTPNNFWVIGKALCLCGEKKSSQHTHE